MSHTGSIKKIIWVVIDVEFNDGYIPEIYEALEVQGAPNKLVLEVQQQLGDGIVRTIAMNPVDGVKRGLAVIATGAPISVPVGEAVLGRMFNVLGDPIDEMDAPKWAEKEVLSTRSLQALKNSLRRLKFLKLVSRSWILLLRCSREER
jgi:F-type H+-transporting ATPase subunit beta